MYDYIHIPSYVPCESLEEEYRYLEYLDMEYIDKVPLLPYAHVEIEYDTRYLESQIEDIYSNEYYDFRAEFNAYLEYNEYYD